MLSEDREACKEGFIVGGYTPINQGDWAMCMNQAKVIGRCEMAQMILDLEFNQLGDTDGKQIRPQTPRPSSAG